MSLIVLWIAAHARPAILRICGIQIESTEIRWAHSYKMGGIAARGHHGRANAFRKSFHYLLMVVHGLVLRAPAVNDILLI